MTFSWQEEFLTGNQTFSSRTLRSRGCIIIDLGEIAGNQVMGRNGRGEEKQKKVIPSFPPQINIRVTFLSTGTDMKSQHFLPVR